MIDKIGKEDCCLQCHCPWDICAWSLAARHHFPDGQGTSCGTGLSAAKSLSVWYCVSLCNLCLFAQAHSSHWSLHAHLLMGICRQGYFPLRVVFAISLTHISSAVSASSV